MITTRLIKTEGEIVSLREKWNDLVEEEGLDISNSYEWAMCLSESHLGKKDIPTIVVEEGGRLLGMFPFFLKKKSVNLFPVTTICPIFHLYSVHNDLLLKRDRPEVLGYIFNGLEKEKKSRGWKVMEIPSVVVGGSTDRMLRTFLDQKGYQYALDRGAASPFIETRGRSWEEFIGEYLAGKNAKMRGNFKRRRKYIEQAGKLEVKMITDCSEILRYLTVIENNSWKYRDGSAITNKNEQLAFYELLIRRLNSQLIFLALFLDETPVAYTLSFVFMKKCYLLKTSYDEKYGKLSPGIVLLLDLLKYCFDKGVSEFDFAGEDEEYKLDFASEVRHHNNYVIFRNDLYSRLVYKSGQIRARVASHVK